MNESTTPPVSGRRISYLDTRTGRPVDADVVAVDEGMEVKLETGKGTVEARLVRAGTTGHQALDNEIITGLRLLRLLAGRSFPTELPRLIGHDIADTEPFALVEPFRGRPCGTEAGRLLPDDLGRFQTSLLTGVRLLSAAGIAHRTLDPRTVRWDGGRVQITGFAHAAVLGEPRTAVGTPPWSAPEQRPGQVAGDVSDRDDLWAVGRLILFMATGARGGEPDAADLPPDLERLVEGLFAAPADRPAVTGLLRRIEAADPVPYGPAPDPGLVAGRQEFFRVRQSKHPETDPDRRTGEEPETVPDPAAQRAWATWCLPSPQWIWLGSSVIALLALATYLMGW